MAPRKKAASKKDIVKNYLTEAVLGFNPGSLGTPVTQVTTMQLNLRYYLISNFRQLLSQSYVEKGLIQAVVDIPVDDGLRGGVEIKSKQLEPEEIEKVNATMEQENDLVTLGNTLKWNRLFGGAGTLIVTDQDPKKPFDMRSIGQDDLLEFVDCDMWELYWTQQNTQNYGAAIDMNAPFVECYDYYGQKIHHTRVMKKTGIRAPSFIRPQMRGWGLSVIETVVDSINQYLKTNSLIFEILDEFKVDVYKIKNLANTLLAPGGDSLVRKRIADTNQQKNFQNAITMDSEDDFIQKELTFTGIAETMAGIRMQIASDLRMPLTKIFGISATGFNSGEDDIENYNAMVEAQIRQKCKRDIIKIVQLRCAQQLGYIPDDLTVQFKPLRIMSAEQEENVKSQKFSRLLSSKQAGEITPEEFRDGCNKDQLLGIQLDKDVVLSQSDDSEAEVTPAVSSAPKSTLQAKEAKS